MCYYKLTILFVILFIIILFKNYIDKNISRGEKNDDSKILIENHGSHDFLEKFPQLQNFNSLNDWEFTYFNNIKYLNGITLFGKWSIVGNREELLFNYNGSLSSLSIDINGTITIKNTDNSNNYKIRSTAPNIDKSIYITFTQEPINYYTVQNYEAVMTSESGFLSEWFITVDSTEKLIIYKKNATKSLSIDKNYIINTSELFIPSTEMLQNNQQYRINIDMGNNYSLRIGYDKSPDAYNFVYTPDLCYGEGTCGNGLSCLNINWNDQSKKYNISSIVTPTKNYLY
jgi:hypothetical protein